MAPTTRSQAKAAKLKSDLDALLGYLGSLEKEVEAKRQSAVRMNQSVMGDMQTMTSRMGNLLPRAVLAAQDADLRLPMTASACSIVLASYWILAREPDGKATRAVNNLKSATEEFTHRLKRIPVNVDMTLFPPADKQTVETLCASIKGLVEFIRSLTGTLELIKGSLEAQAVAFTAILNNTKLYGDNDG